MTTTNMPTRAVAFFFEHAGFGYRPDVETAEQGRKRGAEALAKAEAWAQDEGLVAVWQADLDYTENDFCLPDGKAHVREHGAVGCILYRPCPNHGTECKHAEVLGSLWGITENLDNRKRDNYRRVVEAELASEAMPEEK